MKEEIKEIEEIEVQEIEDLQTTFNEEPVMVLLEEGEAENVVQD
jgi:hypothetical protein